MEDKEETHGIKNKHLDIYHKYSEQYIHFTQKQDHQHNLLPAILNLFPPHQDKVVIDLGAGTGKLTHLLSPHFLHVVALDYSPHMMQKAMEGNWSGFVSDFRYVSLRSHVGDLAIAGWSISYLKVNYEHTWREEMDKVFKEIKRILRPRGTVIIIETLGTGYESPRRAGSHYYQYLTQMGFQSCWVRTDYLFDSVEEAEQQMRFFFGKVVANRVLKENLKVVPECTGIWWCCVDDIP